ncbi:MAG: endonuclease domain-containing protein [Vulcanimicrobiaceae bacterium]
MIAEKQSGLIRCRDCDTEKPGTEFYAVDLRVWKYRCKACSRASRAAYGKTEGFKQRRRNRNIKGRYGIEALPANALCGICGQPEAKKAKDGRLFAIAADHDHLTGQFRGFLCSSCNLGLGKFKDDSNLLRAAIRYLEQVKAIA